MNWFIVIQERVPYNGRFPIDDFRGYRKYSVWPKVFPTAYACDEFLRACFTFRNLNGHKLTASSMNQAQLRNVTWSSREYHWRWKRRQS